MMKKHFKRLFAVMIAAGMLFSSAHTVNAASGNSTVEGAGTVKLNTNGTTFRGLQDVAALPTDPTPIDVQVIVTGGPEILYNIYIGWGNMQFQYCYGKTWNPASHEYLTNANQAEGWSATSVNGTNNKITIKNNTNFPIVADLTYSADGLDLNNDPTATGSVVGIFTDDNSLLTADVLRAGKGSPLLTSSFTATPRRVELEMDGTNLTSGDVLYYIGNNNPTLADSQADMYFALSGKPDAGGPTSYTSVGTINVAISPAPDTTKHPIP